MIRLILIAMFALAPVARAESESEIGRAVYVGDQLLKGYDPVPELVTPQTIVERPKFPAIDVHCHWGLEQQPEALLAAMDELGVEAAVNLSGGWGERLDAMLRASQAAPDRLLIFCNIDFSRIDEENFGENMAEFLEQARENGAAGLKIFKDLGLMVRDASGAVVAVDDPRLDPIWRKAGEMGMPVAPPPRWAWCLKSSSSSLPAATWRSSSPPLA